MGTLKKVANVDYSQNAVGKYDFETNIFRRKVNGTLERNFLNLTRSKAVSFTPVSLEGGLFDLRVNYFDNYTSQTATLFSVCDYSLRRAIHFSVQVSANKQNLLIWVGKEIDFANKKAEGYQDTCLLGDVGVTNEHCVHAVIDFNQLKVISLTYNGVPKAVTRGSKSEPTNYFTNGQTRTIAFGTAANILTDTETGNNNVGYGKPSFGQLVNSLGQPILHFDFLGDTHAEILTDKAQLITLQDIGANITSRPITL